jgi:NAD(P)-dependent dehydrogenase (short-subunit alcohol dehydrogenase family)
VDLGLRERVVLVTGGSDGLGAALAERLVREGARVAICARGEDRLEATASSLREAGGEILAQPADVTRAADAERLLAAIDGRWGRLDGLVNNAGAMAGEAFGTLTDDDWRADLELKLLAAARFVRLALTELRAAGDASIVNVLNHYAKAPEAGTMPTAVSRAAGMAMTKALSRELAPDGVRVNGIVVGSVDSGQWRRLAERRGLTLDALRAEMVERQRIPLGRVGRAEEFADVAAFLLSPRSSYVTGTAVNVDGGVCATV